MEAFEPVGYTGVKTENASIFYLSVMGLYFIFFYWMIGGCERRIQNGR